jgi:hypothetical protein
MRTPQLTLALASLLALALASCGDNLGVPDARRSDSQTGQVPAPPRLGTQIDRMGRPAVNAALIGLRDIMEVSTMKKDAYNAASDPATWESVPLPGGRTVVDEIAANLAIFDVLDKGNMDIPGATGCQNQLYYNGNPMAGGTPGPMSYRELAKILADDMLYVNTDQQTCTAYLALELQVVRSGNNAEAPMQCGGRSPTADVIDSTYSALIAGLAGFTTPPTLLPLITDGVGAHADLSDSNFPYFGPPH